MICNSFVRLFLALLVLFTVCPAYAAFTDNGDGTVTDTETSLMWDKCSWGLSNNTTCADSAVTIHTWSQALGVAVTANAMNSGVGYKSHNDWRLPNLNELESLVKTAAHDPAIDTTVFPNTMGAWYWSSTNDARVPADAWFVDFYGGHPNTGSKSSIYCVRLVRSGQSFGSFDAQAAPTDTTPDAFSFTAQTGAALSSLATSNTLTVSGINSAAAISITGGTYSINGGAYTSVAGTISNGQTVTVRQTSSASYSTLTTATLTIGGVNGAFNVTTQAVPADTTPDAFSFTAQTGAALSSVATSNTITVSGINSAAAISITGGAYSINGGGYVSSAGTVNNGDTVTVRQTSSGSYSTLTTATLTIGGVSGAFNVTTLAAPVDTVPDAFSFTAQTGAALSSVATSNTITVSGINSAAAISITGGTYSINGGAYTSAAGTVSNGQTVTVRQTSSASYSTLTTATLTIGGVNGVFNVTTQAVPVDTTPDAFSFTAQTGAALSSVATSNIITVSGINSAANISITGGTYSINGGAYTSAAGTVSNGQTVTVRQTSSGSYSTLTTATLTIGGVSGVFNVTTQAAPAVITSYTAPSATGTGNITAGFTGGGAGCGYSVSQYIPLTGHAASPPAGSAPAGISFPHGLFDFTTGGCTPGSTITMTITYPQALPAGATYWKYGPTPTDGSYHWYRLPATIAGNTATFSITDGGLGDDDLSANGTIVDQGGPGVPGGAASIPTLSEWALLALAGLMGLFGLRAMQRRQAPGL